METPESAYGGTHAEGTFDVALVDFYTAWRDVFPQELRLGALDILHNLRMSLLGRDGTLFNQGELNLAHLQLMVAKQSLQRLHDAHVQLVNRGKASLIGTVKMHKALHRQLRNGDAIVRSLETHLVDLIKKCGDQDKESNEGEGSPQRIPSETAQVCVTSTSNYDIEHSSHGEQRIGVTCQPIGWLTVSLPQGSDVQFILREQLAMGGEIG